LIGTSMSGTITAMTITGCRFSWRRDCSDRLRTHLQRSEVLTTAVTIGIGRRPFDTMGCRTITAG
jgi:hypothetical protein